MRNRILLSFRDNSDCRLLCLSMAVKGSMETCKKSSSGNTCTNLSTSRVFSISISVLPISHPSTRLFVYLIRHMIHVLEKVRKLVLKNIYRCDNLTKGLTVVSQTKIEMGMLLGHKEPL